MTQSRTVYDVKGSSTSDYENIIQALDYLDNARQIASTLPHSDQARECGKLIAAAIDVLENGYRP